MTDDDLVLIEESAATPLQKKGKKWLVTLAVPGVGAHGDTFSAEMLETTGPIAVPGGTKSFFKHAATEERDPRDQVGVFKEGAFWNEDEQKLQAWLTPFPRYEQVLEEAGSSIEASLHVQGRRDLRNPKIMKELTFRRDNTVDLVAFGGLVGSGLEYQVVESLFAAAAAENEKENTMAFEITEKAWDDFRSEVTAGFAAFDTFIAESLKGQQGQADDAKVAELVDARVEEALTAIAEVEVAIDAADIPATVKESLKAESRKGVDVSDDLAGAVAVVEAMRAEAAAPKGGKRANLVVVAESLSEQAPKNYRVKNAHWTGATK